VLLVPLAVNHDLFGVLTVGGDQPMPVDVHSSLETLATQVALRLENAALTEQLTEMAFRDALTGLANRALVRDTIARALSRSRRTGRPFGLLLLDLDGFKQINDSLGHEAGDDVLVATAARLRECLRDEETAGRLGGDEFAVVIEDLVDARGAIAVAERIMAALHPTITVSGHRVQVRTSIGIALSNAEVSDAGDMLRNADVAMYRAKRRGTGSYELYELGMHAAAIGRLQMEADLRLALEREELAVHYQPIVRSTPVRSPALRRWSAGTTRSAARSRRPSSSRSPRRRGSSCRWANGSWRRPAGRWRGGRPCPAGNRSN
jgi:diguanylate cyclase (GGDEF)-like protein